MKSTHLLFILLLFLASLAYAQTNSYKSLGVDVEVLTLSKGKYKEIFNDERFVQIGTLLYDTEEKRVVEVLDKDSIPEKFYLPPLANSRWISVDPLADEFENVSPYIFGNNNPIRFTDPTGMAPEDIILTGNSSQKTRLLAHLQTLTNDKLDFVPETGEVFVTESGGANQARSLNEGTDLVRGLLGSDKVISIKQSKINGTNPVDESGNQTTGAEQNTRNGKGTNSVVRFDPASKGEQIKNEDGTTGRPSVVGLAHELIHADNNRQGINTNQEATNLIDPDGNGIRTVTREELNVRTRENIIRHELGVKPRAIPKEKD